jgi:hypothetical protein
MVCVNDIIKIGKERIKVSDKVARQSALMLIGIPSFGIA